MTGQPSNLVVDGDTEAAPESLQAIIGEALRDCLVELVDECLRHKPDGVEAESYFADVLEPLFRYITADCIDSRPEDPVEFVQAWVEEKMKLGASNFTAELLAPLPCVKAWCDKQLRFKLKQTLAMEALQAEVLALHRQLQMVKEGLGRTSAGQEMLAAVAVGDQAAFDAALDALSNVGPPNNNNGAIDMFMATPPSTAEAEAAETMGEVLRGLRLRGVMSASAAFQHFQPGEDGCISSVLLLKEINSFGSISPQKSSRLVDNLDRRGNGRVEYRDFRSKISGFLATSSDFHPSLSADELHAILARIHDKLLQQGLNVSEAFREWDSNASGTLECTEFMAGLRGLHLGLSGKEVAQVFNAMSDSNAAAGHEGNRRAVSLQAFQDSLVRGEKQNRLKDWATASFSRLRETLELGAVERSLRHYAEQPECQHMHYSGFSALASDTESAFSSIETGKLWCVLEKEDGVEEPSVGIEELLRWMSPQRSSGASINHGKATSGALAISNTAIVGSGMLALAAPLPVDNVTAVA